MSLRIGVVMDPIAKIKPWKDSTFAMMLEAQRRGWSLHYMEPGDLYVRDGRTFAATRTLTVTDNNDDWYRMADAVNHDLADLDIILMRQDPPFNTEYIYATYLLEKAEREGVLVVNRPGSVRKRERPSMATRL